MKCIKCHTQNEEDAKFCANCGAPLKKEKTHSANNDRKMYIIIGGLIVAIALTGAALIAVNKKSEKEYDKAISILEQGKEHVDSERIDDKILEITKEIENEQEKEQEVIPETEEVTVPESNEIPEETPEPSLVTVDTFLAEKKYLEYTESFENGIAKCYAIIDINQDGIDELLISSQVMDNEFEHISIFGVVDNEVQLVDELDTCYGVYYSQVQGCLIYADCRPSAMGGSENYYFYGDHTKDYVVAWGLDMTTYEPEYEKILPNGEQISMTSNEYDQYQNEVTYISFYDF